MHLLYQMYIVHNDILLLLNVPLENTVTKSFKKVCEIRKKALQHTSILILDAARKYSSKYFAPQPPGVNGRPLHEKVNYDIAKIFVPSDAHPPPSNPPYIHEPYIGEKINTSYRTRKRLKEVPAGFDPNFLSHVKLRLKDLKVLDSMINQTMKAIPVIDFSKPISRHHF